MSALFPKKNESYAGFPSPRYDNFVHWRICHGRNGPRHYRWFFAKLMVHFIPKNNSGTVHVILELIEYCANENVNPLMFPFRWCWHFRLILNPVASIIELVFSNSDNTCSTDLVHFLDQPLNNVYELFQRIFQYFSYKF